MMRLSSTSAMLVIPTTDSSVTTTSTTTASLVFQTINSVSLTGLFVQTVRYCLFTEYDKRSCFDLDTQCPNPANLTTDEIEPVGTYTADLNYTSTLELVQIM